MKGRLDKLRDPISGETVVFYRGQHIHMLRRPDLIDAASDVIGELMLHNHITSYPVWPRNELIAFVMQGSTGLQQRPWRRS